MTRVAIKEQIRKDSRPENRFDLVLYFALRTSAQLLSSDSVLGLGVRVYTKRVVSKGKSTLNLESFIVLFRVFGHIT